MPTKESLDRAKAFMSERQGFRPLVESLALEFDRVRLEARMDQVEAMERDHWNTLRDGGSFKSVASWYMELRAQLAALNAMGEGE